MPLRASYIAYADLRHIILLGNLEFISKVAITVHETYNKMKMIIKGVDSLEEPAQDFCT